MHSFFNVSFIIHRYLIFATVARSVGVELEVVRHQLHKKTKIKDSSG